jgi:hypothetical protein
MADDFNPEKKRASAACRDARTLVARNAPADHFDLIAVHSRLFLVSTKPLPLQAFWPLHELAAPLQALWPLQAFAPAQATSADADTATKVVAANTAAAAAIMDFFCMF